MPRLSTRLPKYRKHRASGQAIVTLGGRDHYLGPWKSVASKREYDRLTGEWLASGGVRTTDPTNELTVVELLAAFWRHAKAYYVDSSGKPNAEAGCFATLIKRLKAAYGATPVVEFGPLRLKAFRASLVADGLARGYVNHSVNRLRHIVKWGVENELVRPEVFEALKCVAGLRYGKSEAKETEPIKPVPEAFVDAVLSFVPPQIAAMIELQRVTGMRSGEVVIMRGRDLNTAGDVWTFTPARHKTQYRGHVRTIYLGPKAQDVVRPWLRTDLEAHLFSPADAEQWRKEQRHAARRTPLSCGNRPGSNLVRKPRKAAGDCYDTKSYRRAIQYGIDQCNAARRNAKQDEIPAWHPHQLRHNAATFFRREHGLEVARVLLGHKHAAITEVYAEADKERALAVMGKIG